MWEKHRFPIRNTWFSKFRPPNFDEISIIEIPSTNFIMSSDAQSVIKWWVTLSIFEPSPAQHSCIMLPAGLWLVIPFSVYQALFMTIALNLIKLVTWNSPGLNSGSVVSYFYGNSQHISKVPNNKFLLYTIVLGLCCLRWNMLYLDWATSTRFVREKEYIKRSALRLYTNWWRTTSFCGSLRRSLIKSIVLNFNS